jgi:hypothetical protein
VRRDVEVAQIVDEPMSFQRPVLGRWMRQNRACSRGGLPPDKMAFGRCGAGWSETGGGAVRLSRLIAERIFKLVGRLLNRTRKSTANRGGRRLIVGMTMVGDDNAIDRKASSAAASFGASIRRSPSGENRLALSATRLD